MPQKGEKRIVIRVDLAEWELYDNKRHGERASFQQLGESLLKAWYEGALPPVPATGETRVAGRAHPDAESKSPTPQEVAGYVEFLMNAGRDEDVRAILTIVRSLCHEPKGSPHQNEAAEVSDAEAIRAANRLAKAARGGNASARRALEKLGFTLAANGGDTGTEGANSKKKAS